MTYPIGDRVVIASVSGGKDSTAMCLHLRERGISYRAVFIDTGWENAATYRYVREDLPGIVGPIEWIRKERKLKPDDEELALHFEDRIGHYSPMIREIIYRSSFARRFRRWCTGALKAEVIWAYLDGMENEPINAVGIRAAESASRSKLSEWEFQDQKDLWTWRPLIGWTEQDVIDIHTRHSVRPNPNYLAGASRVGCWPCVFARKSELRAIADSDPQRIEIIEDLERVITGRVRERYKQNGKTLDRPLAFFSHRGSGQSMPISEAVSWSRTKRGGRQFELFAPAQRDQGCMRWGLCDVGKDETTE